MGMRTSLVNMDPLFEAHSFYLRKNYGRCIDICTELLEKNPYDEASWVLKMRALTKRVYIDDLESEDLNEEFMDDAIIASAPRPGTSLRTALHTASGSSTARPRSSTGRPISGIARPGTQMRPGSTIERARTSRPLTTCSARTIRLGTAAMLSMKDGPFIQVSRLNLNKYAAKNTVAKALFEYLYYHEGDIRVAMELAVQATQLKKVPDWWWCVQLAKCYCSLNMVRNGEQQLKIALSQHETIEIFIRLARVYIRLDQPLAAIEICKAGLDKFPNDVAILTELARLYESLGETDTSANHYREIVIQDAMNVEAIACIGLHHFYTDQPEMAMRYYRRVLQMGVYSAELYNNIGLCCLYSLQLDLTLACFQRALDLATEPEIKSEVWYNLSHVAISSGDLNLARNCLHICLVHDPSHALALNNLAVLEYRLGNNNVVKTYLTTAQSLDHSLEEPKTNLEILSEQY